VPELSEDFYSKNFERLRKNMQRGLYISLLVACALIPFFYALGNDLGRLAFSNDLAGKLIVQSCPLLLPMSLTMISTGMLNAMGFERKTFLYYFIGAAVMLLCVIVLPSVCGVYAYIIGMGASFLINAVCNLVFLYKKQLIFKKGRGHVRVERIFCPIFLILPLSLLGQFLNVFFKNYFGQISTLFLTATLLTIATTLLYALCKILPLKQILRKIFPFLPF
jgi:O-antigen/teichoic acid export membrane protein